MNILLIIFIVTSAYINVTGDYFLYLSVTQHIFLSQIYFQLRSILLVKIYIIEQ